MRFFLMLALVLMGCGPEYIAEQRFFGNFYDEEFGWFQTTLEFNSVDIDIEHTPDEVAETASAALHAFREIGRSKGMDYEALEQALPCVQDSLVRVADDAYYYDTCPGYSIGHYLPRDGVVLLSIPAGYSCRNLSPIIGHEFLHAIVECLGLKGNAEHTTPFVFGLNPEDGIAGFAEDTAEGLLAYHPTAECAN
jgi:hypothetical protein